MALVTSSTSKTNHFSEVSEEVIYVIFSKLDMVDLVNCSKVDRLFNRITQDETLWKALFPHIKLPEGQLIRDHIVVSEKQLLNRIAQFMQTKRMDEFGRIIFKLNDNCQIEVEMTYGRRKLLPPTQQKTIFIAKQIPTIEEANSDSDPTIGLDRGMFGNCNYWISKTNVNNVKSKPLIEKIDDVLKKRLYELDKQKILSGAVKAIALVALTAVRFLNRNG